MTLSWLFNALIPTVYPSNSQTAYLVSWKMALCWILYFLSTHQSHHDSLLIAINDEHLPDTRVKTESSFYRLSYCWQTHNWKWRKSLHILISLGPFVTVERMKKVITLGSWEVITIPLEVNLREEEAWCSSLFSISYRWSTFGIAVKVAEIAFCI